MMALESQNCPRDNQALNKPLGKANSMAKHTNNATVVITASQLQFLVAPFFKDGGTNVAPIINDLVNGGDMTEAEAKLKVALIYNGYTSVDSVDKLPRLTVRSLAGGSKVVNFKVFVGYTELLDKVTLREFSYEFDAIDEASGKPMFHDNDVKVANYGQNITNLASWRNMPAVTADQLNLLPAQLRGAAEEIICNNHDTAAADSTNMAESFTF